jgi:hypothetical protein
MYDLTETSVDTGRGDLIFTCSRNDILEPNRRGYDDDADGRIDEDDLDGFDNDGDWLINRDDLNHNGKPDHGEPNVDEDYGAVSDVDVYLTYRDSFDAPRMPLHSPLSLKIRQKSYAWKDDVKEPILFLEYYFINDWLRTLDSVYLGFYAGIKPEDSLSLPKANVTRYLEDVRTASAVNVFNASVGAIGVTLLGSSAPWQSLKITYKRYFRGRRPSQFPFEDEARYSDLSLGTIDSNSAPDDYTPILLGVGPFPTMHPGDTLKLAIALVAGDRLQDYPNNIHDNAARALDIYRRNYLPPAVPPSPPLRLSAQDQGVRLDFDWRPGDPHFNPLETWDDSNKLVGVLPDTHWRRRNPPSGHTSGGRVFEAFRIYRSDYPLFEENQFSLIHQFDIDDDLGLEGQTGLSLSFIDSTIRRGKQYWYTVTALSVPDQIYLSYTTVTGGQAIDTVLTTATESKMFENVQRYGAPFSPSAKLGEVKVVPNPYRTDRNYIYEQGGWEGLGRLWNENRRVVWFIHLPPKCTIRIFSLAGEVIKTIAHDDDNRQSRNVAVGQEEFELLSESNRALASGIYIYLVESGFGTQIGKFVVIR